MMAPDQPEDPDVGEATDEELLDHLRALASVVDPVPDEVRLAARSAIAYRDMDVRLAELVDQAPAAAGVRADAGAPWFTFETDDLVVEVAVTRRDGTPHVVGQVDGADVEAATVRHAGGEATPTMDELGRFSCVIEPGPLRVELRLGDGRTVVTSWVVAPAP